MVVPVMSMRVLYLSHSGVVGGAESSLLELIRNLDRDRFSPIVALPPWAGGRKPRRLQDAFEGEGVETVPMPLLRFKRTGNPLVLTRYVLSVLTVSVRLWRLIRRERVRLVHSNSSTAQIYGGLAARLAGVPSIWHSRDLVDLGSFGRWLYAVSSKIVAVSEAVARSVRRYGADGAKVSVIYNGVDTDRWVPPANRAEARAGLGLPSDAFVVGMAGQLAPWKKHDVFIDAAAMIMGQCSNAFFLVIGGDMFDDHPEYVAALHGRAGALGFGERIRFTGHVENVLPVFQGLDVLVHPADAEPFGRVVAEAMALEKPVVAVDSAGPKEIIEPGVSGLLVSSGDSAALAQAVLRLAADRELAAAIGKAARKRICDRFTAVECAKRMQDLYTAILDGSKPCE